MRKLYIICGIIVMTFVHSHNALAQTCDTVKYQESATWTDTNYRTLTPFPDFYGGYVNGTDGFGTYQKANYFDLSGTSFTYILGTSIKFNKANSTKSANLSKIIYFKVYDDNGGKPGTLLGTAQHTLSEIKTDVDAGKNTLIDFSPAIALPASKKFYVSVDISNFNWSISGLQKDSIAIGSTKDDEVLPNTAWEYEDDSTWVAFPDNWFTDSASTNPLSVQLWIFPYVSINSAGCGVLPVNLLSFNAERKNNDVTLNWEVSAEMNMKGYEIEKANNNGVFSNLMFVPAFNNLKNQKYTATDKNAFANSPAVQYRLKQIDGDGRITYSKIITLKNNSVLTDAVFANPFTGALKLQLNLSVASTVALQLYDMQGRLVAVQNAALYGVSGNSITMAATENLAPGNYFLKVNVNKEVFVYKLVKQ